MKIVYIHYHLKPGGVTTVVKQQVEAIQDTGSTLVLTGKLPAEPFPGKIKLIPGLGYDDDCCGNHDPEATAEAVVTSIYDTWPDGCDLIHVHNPLLAKNKGFLSVLKILQKRGFRLFLQVHDFAEDGRLRSYYSDEYPRNCHYGVINVRDYKILKGSGLKSTGLHLLGNAIGNGHLNRQQSKTGNRVVYPVRAIRRKNVGEAILISIFLKEGEELLLTLPPNSPADMKSYQEWQGFTAKNRLPVRFGAGIVEPFEELIRLAKFILTTSISEGFGFAFLDTWLDHKLLWGRFLPDICDEFERNGIKLDHLYHKLTVPLEMIDREAFFQRWRNCLVRVCQYFKYHLEEPMLSRAFASMLTGDTVDFGLLDELAQKQVINQLLENRNQKRRLVEINPFLKSPGVIKGEKHCIDHNRAQIVEQYKQSGYRDNLLDIYKCVLNRSVRQRIDKKKVLSRFLNPFDFSLLKWGDDG